MLKMLKKRSLGWVHMVVIHKLNVYLKPWSLLYVHYIHKDRGPVTCRSVMSPLLDLADRAQDQPKPHSSKLGEGVKRPKVKFLALRWP